MIKNVVIFIMAAFCAVMLMAQDSLTDSSTLELSDSSAVIVPADSSSLAVLNSIHTLSLQDTGISDGDFLYPMLYVLAVSFLGFFSAKIPYLNTIKDTKIRTLFGAIGLGIIFSLSFGVSILQLALAYGVASGIIYDLLIKKLAGLSSFKTSGEV